LIVFHRRDFKRQVTNEGHEIRQRNPKEGGAKQGMREPARENKRAKEPEEDLSKGAKGAGFRV
jgi:hypothetical protein